MATTNRFLWEVFKHDVLSWADEKIAEFTGTRLVVMPLKAVRFLAEFSVSHPVQVFLVFVGSYVLFVSFCVMQSLGRVESPITNIATAIPGEKIDELRFDYLPSSPLDNGWHVAYPKAPETEEKWKSAKWSLALDSPVPGGLRMQVDPGCAIDNFLDPNKRQAEWMRYEAKLTNQSMIFVLVRLGNANGLTAEKWIKFGTGTQPAHPTPAWEAAEWTFYLKGVSAKNSWRRFEVCLPKAVEGTWTTYGWRFQGLLRIRLRGELSISPIEFYEVSS